MNKNVDKLIENEINDFENLCNKEEIIVRCLENRLKITSSNIASNNNSVRKALESVFANSKNPINTLRVINKIKDKSLTNSNFLFAMIFRVLYGK